MNYAENSTVMSFVTVRDQQRLAEPYKFPRLKLGYFEQPTWPSLPNTLNIGTGPGERWSDKRITRK